MASSIAAICAARVLKSAAAAGVDCGDLAPAPLAEGDPFEERIPWGDLITLWEGVMRRVRDPGFPVVAGAAGTVHEFDAVGFACMTQPTLREAIHQCVRFSRAWTDASEWSVANDDGTVRMIFRCADPERMGVRCATESVLAEMAQAGRLLTGHDYAITRVRFRHRAPRDTARHEAFFRGAIEWGAPCNEIALANDLAALPLLKADPALAGFFERHLRRMLGETGAQAGGMASRVRSLLADELRRGAPTLETVAARLGMSSRTLKRRLHDEGTTFQDVLDAVRCDLAKRYLDERRLALGEVSFLLGFSEPSAFHRAFKRWTGRTPLSYQRAALA